VKNLLIARESLDRSTQKTGTYKNRNRFPIFFNKSILAAHVPALKNKL
jgi:hypothetical protein